MVSLAAFRYRNVLASDGGPVAALEMGQFPVRGRQMTMVNARLVPAAARSRAVMTLYSDADGTGTHPIPSVARHKAISEAMERWAFHATVRSERAADYGFDLDPSSTGMAAFPGLLARQARKSAVLEAVERFSLIAWWDGSIDGRIFQTDWPGVSAVAIDGPFGGVTVVAFARTEWGGHVYGHAADESFGAACERAVMELARHEWVLRARWLMVAGGERTASANVFERRCLFFASEEGHALFQERLARRADGRPPAVDVICDREIPGPWSDYATVWRFALRPPSDGYLRGGERYFFL
jgi:ribosomal protein S12 methylthiotransferase accessory factor YcaO